MPRLSGLCNTCSMSELGLFNGDIISPSKIKEYLLAKKIDYNYSPSARQKKAIICNTIHHVDTLKKCGFIEVAQYFGNDYVRDGKRRFQRVGIVHVMLYIQPKCQIKPPKKGHPK